MYSKTIPLSMSILLALPLVRASELPQFESSNFINPRDIIPRQDPESDAAVSADSIAATLSSIASILLGTEASKSATIVQSVEIRTVTTTVTERPTAESTPTQPAPSSIPPTTKIPNAAPTAPAPAPNALPTSQVPNAVPTTASVPNAVPMSQVPNAVPTTASVPKAIPTSSLVKSMPTNPVSTSMPKNPAPNSVATNAVPVDSPQIITMGDGSTTTTTAAGSRTTVGAAAASVMPDSSQMSQAEASMETEMVRDPANGAFPGGFPAPLPDVPVTAVFLLLFMGGAFTHISIYRANSKRGHRFLLSDLMFDFCMIRNLTCIFRIIWSFISPRGVILGALIFENGGAAVIFAVNLFFAQRIFRAMHPEIGWHPLFKIFTYFLIWSVPAVIILNIVSLSVSWFSVGKEAQLARTEMALMFGASWNVMLSVMPLVMLVIAGALPAKKKPEKFGAGTLARKTALLGYSSATLAVGAAVRAATIINPVGPGTQDILFGKSLFYTTGFMLEILVVAIYAVARIDLLFYVPDGSSKPGDYSAAQKVLSKRGFADMHSDIEENLGRIGIEYETISAPVSADERSEFVFARLFINKGSPTLPGLPGNQNSGEEVDGTAEVYIPPRPNRVSRRATMMQAIRPNRPFRDTLQGPYITGPLDPPSQNNIYPPEKY